MATNFGQFTTSASPLTTEYAVGYATAVSGGERRWLWSDVRTLMLASYGGATSITTVGTIATGTWQGTAIADSYISSAATWNAKQSAITFGTGVQTALGVNIGSAGAPVLFNGALGTPSSGTVTNLTGTASININGTVGATTPTTAAFTTVATSAAVTSTFTGQTADTYFAGLSLINSTAAAATDQQHSPSITLSGQGWKTDATAASRQVDWRITNVPVEGASNPTSTLIFAAQINGGGYATRLVLGSSGAGTVLAVTGNASVSVDLTVGGNFTGSGQVGAGAAATFYFTGRSVMSAPSDGVLSFTNNSVNSFTRLNFGGTTSSFVALQTSGTTLTVGTADGGTGAGSLDVRGALTVAGVTVPTISSTSTLTNKTLTSPVLTTPNLGTATAGDVTACTIKTVIQLACSDTTTAITAGNGKMTFRMPYAMTLTAVRASVSTAPTGANIVIGINESGSTILSTDISIDAGEKTSTTAATQPVISDSALADDAEMTIDFDQVGSSVAGVGVIVTLIGTRA